MRITYREPITDSVTKYIRLPKNSFIWGIQLCGDGVGATQFAINDYKALAQISDNPKDEDFANTPICFDVFYKHYLDKTENKSYSIVLAKWIDYAKSPIFLKNPVLRVQSIGVAASLAVIVEIK